VPWRASARTTANANRKRESVRGDLADGDKLPWPQRLSSSGIPAVSIKLGASVWSPTNPKYQTRRIGLVADQPQASNSAHRLGRRPAQASNSAHRLGRQPAINIKLGASAWSPTSHKHQARRMSLMAQQAQVPQAAEALGRCPSPYFERMPMYRNTQTTLRRHSWATSNFSLPPRLPARGLW
jgi:hypothetical protein